jgi:hypothetical protein
MFDPPPIFKPGAYKMKVWEALLSTELSDKTVFKFTHVLLA